MFGDSRGNTNGLPIFIILVHQHLDAVGVGWGDPGAACDGEVVAGIEWWWLLPAVDQRSQHVGRHAPEALADEAVEKEVDTGVEQRQHVRQVGEHVEQSAGALRGGRRRVEVVENHQGARRPQHRKDGSDGQKNSSGLAGGVAAQTEAATTPAELPHDDGIEREEDRAGEEVDGGAVGPHQDMLCHSSSVALLPATTAHTWQAVPQLRPPVIRGRREQAPDVNSEYHPSRASRVGDRVVA